MTTQPNVLVVMSIAPEGRDAQLLGAFSSLERARSAIEEIEPIGELRFTELAWGAIGKRDESTAGATAVVQARGVRRGIRRRAQRDPRNSPDRQAERRRRSAPP